MGAAAGQERAAGRAAAGPGAGGRGRPGGAALPAASPGRASAGRCAAGEGRRRARGEGPPRPARGPAPGPRPRGCPRPAGERGDRGRPSGRSEGWARAGLEGGGTAGPPGRAPSPRRKRGAGGRRAPPAGDKAGGCRRAAHLPPPESLRWRRPPLRTELLGREQGRCGCVWLAGSARRGACEIIFSSPRARRLPCRCSVFVLGLGSGLVRALRALRWGAVHIVTGVFCVKEEQPSGTCAAARSRHSGVFKARC